MNKLGFIGVIIWCLLLTIMTLVSSSEKTTFVLFVVIFETIALVIAYTDYMRGDFDYQSLCMNLSVIMMLMITGFMFAILTYGMLFVKIQM